MPLASPMNTVTVTLPLPAKCLSPNARVHWAKKAKATKNARFMAYIALAMPYPPRWERATLGMTFYWPTKAAHDDDNAAASCKAYRDGIADAGIVANDRGISTLPPVMLHDKKNPRVVLTITNTPSKE